MLAIKTEIEAVVSGDVALDESALRQAPHPAENLLDDRERAYSATDAAYPVRSLRADKYWPPVSRIDGAYGDRNLVCDCAPLEAYADDI
jgi:glycine dehydrogenase